MSADNQNPTTVSGPVALPPITIRYGEGVEAGSLKRRAKAYRERGLSWSDAAEQTVDDALDALAPLEPEWTDEQPEETGNTEDEH